MLNDEHFSHLNVVLSKQLDIDSDHNREKLRTERKGCYRNRRPQDGRGKLFATPTCHMKFFLFLLVEGEKGTW